MSFTPQIGDPALKTPAVKQARGLCAPCPVYEKCLFHMPRYGGFKGQGPRNVVYSLRTDKVENHNAKEECVSCMNFVETMQDRMLSGRAAADEGRAGAERVSVLVGRTSYRMGTEMPFNGKGEIIKQPLYLIDDLKRAGYKVNQDDMTNPARWQTVVFDRIVPDYNAPQVTSSTYSEEISARMAEQEQRDIEEDDGRWEAKMAETDPQKVRRGRPPGSRNKEKDDEQGDDFA